MQNRLGQGPDGLQSLPNQPCDSKKHRLPSNSHLPIGFISMLMLTRPTLLAALLLTATTPPAAAQNAESPLGLTPDDASALLGQLQKLHEDFSNSREELLSSALTRIRAATASESTAAELYLAAQKIVAFGAPGSTTATEEPKGWREEQIEWLKESGAPKAIRVQLAWIALLIEANQKPEDEHPALLKKAHAIAKEAATVAQDLALLPAAGGGGGRGGSPGEGGRRGPGGSGGGGGGRRDVGQFLAQSIFSSVFSQAYNLQNHIKPPQGWALAPLDLEGVYERMLMADARKHHPADLAPLWDERVQVDAALHRAAMSEDAFLTWGQVEGRNLQWRKHLDLLRSGVGGRAAGLELIRLFKENPTHPNIATWKKDLDDIMDTITKGT
jgi:hypothetical protein